MVNIFTCGTELFPKIPFSTAMQRPTITSSLTFSMMAAASPATRASNTGALYRFLIQTRWTTYIFVYSYTRQWTTAQVSVKHEHFTNKSREISAVSRKMITYLSRNERSERWSKWNLPCFCISRLRNCSGMTYQKRKSSPRLAVVLPTWPNRLELGSQKIRSKHKTT